MTAARMENPDKTVTGTFTTTTRLAERARKFAEVLDIRIEEGFPLSDYPWIKCNISSRDGERIYHLPFDQQYDATVIDQAADERYVMTCAEAEQLGIQTSLALARQQQRRRRMKTTFSPYIALGAERLGWCRCHLAVFVYDDHLACVVF
jgi:hypothetical protein